LPPAPLSPDRSLTDAVVEVIDWHGTADPSSNIKLTATVRLGGVTVRNVRLMEGKRGTLWVSLPTHKVDDEWEPLVLLTDRLRIAVLNALTDSLYGPPDESDAGAPF
jgi:DNA-binding cell septation regulator SpoVG